MIHGHADHWSLIMRHLTNEHFAHKLNARTRYAWSCDILCFYTTDEISLRNHPRSTQILDLSILPDSDSNINIFKIVHQLWQHLYFLLRSQFSQVNLPELDFDLYVKIEATNWWKTWLRVYQGGGSHHRTILVRWMGWSCIAKRSLLRRNRAPSALTHLVEANG